MCVSAIHLSLRRLFADTSLVRGRSKGMPNISTRPCQGGCQTQSDERADAQIHVPSGISCPEGTYRAVRHIASREGYIAPSGISFQGNIALRRSLYDMRRSAARYVCVANTIYACSVRYVYCRKRRSGILRPARDISRRRHIAPRRGFQAICCFRSTIYGFTARYVCRQTRDTACAAQLHRRENMQVADAAVDDRIVD